jgi:hypothetical protein
MDLAKRSGHIVTVADRTAQRYDADAYVIIQDFGIFGCPRPRVLISHALGLAKKVQFDLDVQLIVFPSDEYYKSVASEVRPATEVASGLGSSKIDLLLKKKVRKESIQERVREVYGFDARPIVGYCPTFRHDGSLAHPQRCHRLRRVEEILERHFNVIVLHHSLEADQSEVEELRFRLTSEVPRLDHLIALDFAITDISGVGFELCALDTPTVLLDEPSVEGYLNARLLARGVRVDYGPVCTLEELSAQAPAIFESARAFSNKRAEWAALAFGPCDGNSSLRILQSILNFAARYQLEGTGPIGAQEIGPPIANFCESNLQFFSINGEVRKAESGLVEITIAKPNEIVFYGPYLRLGAGSFVLEVDLATDSGRRARFSIDCDAARVNLGQVSFVSGLKTCLAFDIDEKLVGMPVEFRLIPIDPILRVEIRVLRLFYSRVGDWDMLL